MIAITIRQLQNIPPITYEETPLPWLAKLPPTSIIFHRIPKEGENFTCSDNNPLALLLLHWPKHCPRSRARLQQRDTGTPEGSPSSLQAPYPPLPSATKRAVGGKTLYNTKTPQSFRLTPNYTISRHLRGVLVPQDLNISIDHQS